MSSSKNKRYQTRRDRRKAKQSCWKRPGKTKWNKCGHGAGTFSGENIKMRSNPKKPQIEHDTKMLVFSLCEFFTKL